VKVSVTEGPADIVGSWVDISLRVRDPHVVHPSDGVFSAQSREAVLSVWFSSRWMSEHAAKANALAGAACSVLLFDGKILDEMTLGALLHNG
jgi:hypothetical protein